MATNHPDSDYSLDGALVMSDIIPVNTRYWSNVVLMLGQRRWWWVNINTGLGWCLVLAGYYGTMVIDILEKKSLSQSDIASIKWTWQAQLNDKSEKMKWIGL